LYDRGMYERKDGAMVFRASRLLSFRNVLVRIFHLSPRYINIITKFLYYVKY